MTNIRWIGQHEIWAIALGLVVCVPLMVMALFGGSNAWALVFLLAAGLLFVGPQMLTAVLLSVHYRQQRRILADGRRAEAVVMKTQQTWHDYELGTYVRFWLDVRPPDRPHFSAEGEELFSAADCERVAPGRTVNVMYDPLTDAVVILDLPARSIPTPA